MGVQKIVFDDWSLVVCPTIAMQCDALPTPPAIHECTAFVVLN